MRAAHDPKLRPARIEAARRVRAWHEIADDLVPRLGGRWLVSAGTDLIYAATEASCGQLTRPWRWPTQIELAFVVDDDDQASFLRARPATGDVVGVRRRQAEKELQKTAERPTPEWMK